MSSKSRLPTTVIIIGAGISGMTMACQLKRNFNLDDYCIYDRQSGAGGTWRANTYPGCAVDVPGFCYTFSFAPNPGFSELFPSQPEILDYLTQVAKRFQVDRHITGNTEWIGASWQDARQKWIVRLRDLGTGEEFTQECKVLISAVGALVNPQDFNVPGIESFQGQVVHTSRWKDNLDLKDKNVAVIGNGSSAIQLIPAIIDKTKFVTQFMRTPHHLVPSTNYTISEFWRTLFRNIPFLLFFLRLAMFFYMETAFSQFQDSEKDNALRASSEKTSREWVQTSTPEKYWDILTPKYQFGCKRRLFDRTYSSILHRENIRLTNDSIVEIKSNSILTKSGQEVPVDLILLATGFALTHYDVQLSGRNGRTRAEHWQDFGHKATFKSVAMHGFPNFFYVLGPNSGRVHTSTILPIESYVDLIIFTIRPILLNSASSVEVKASSEQEFDRVLHAAIDKTVHNSSCSSYFIDRQSGKNWFIYPWSSLHLWLSTHWNNDSADWVYERQANFPAGKVSMRSFYRSAIIKGSESDMARKLAGGLSGWLAEANPARPLTKPPSPKTPN